MKFADIEPDTLTIDPMAVEAAITPQTEAILATHVFGNPCEVETLDAIAAKYGLAMIYDAAHAFGVTYKGKSILEYGDASMVSLHATKLFHAVEGGFVVAKDPAVAEKVEWMRRFGHKGEKGFHGVGINAKMSELHAAMGLCNLKYMDRILESRKGVFQCYDLELGSLWQGGERFSRFEFRAQASQNFAYYPVLFVNEQALLLSVENFQRAQIFPRRYFFPALNEHFEASDVLAELPVAERVSRSILCLPLSSSMDEYSLTRVVDGFSSPKG